MKIHRNDSGMSKLEKVEFLRGLMHGTRRLSELSHGKTYLIRPDEMNPDIFYLSHGAGKRQETKLTAKELPKYSFTKKDWIVLIAPFERYGFDPSRKSTVIVVNDLKTGLMILNLSNTNTMITSEGDAIPPPSWFDGSPLKPK